MTIVISFTKVKRVERYILIYFVVYEIFSTRRRVYFARKPIRLRYRDFALYLATKSLSPLTEPKFLSLTATFLTSGVPISSFCSFLYNRTRQSTFSFSLCNGTR